MKDIRVENVKSESIQYYTVRSRVKVRTLTSLDGLLTNDACHCPEEAKSRHFVFLIDSSDSFNHYDGTPKSWSERAKAFLINFVSLGNRSTFFQWVITFRFGTERSHQHLQLQRRKTLGQTVPGSSVTS